MNIIQRFTRTSLVNLTKLRVFTTCNHFSSKIADDEEDQGPIKYTKSPASRWRASSSRSGRVSQHAERLWYEPYVIIASLTVFMVYFCLLREENDIDEELGKSLYARVPGLEEQQLKLVLRYNEEHGIDNTAVIKRLEEIQTVK